MSKLMDRLRRLETNHAMSGWQTETIIVNPNPFDGAPLPPEERERHRLAVLRVARNPKGILITYLDADEPERNHLLELLGPADYATIARHASIVIERSYGV